MQFSGEMKMSGSVFAPNNFVKHLLPRIWTVAWLLILIEARPAPDSTRYAQYHSRDELGNYAFGHVEDSPGSGSYRMESGDVQGRKTGSYGLLHPDGRIRWVRYVADDGGFRAELRTLESGFEAQGPANVALNSGPFPSIESYRAEVERVISRAGINSMESKQSSSD